MEDKNAEKKNTLKYTDTKQAVPDKLLVIYWSHSQTIKWWDATATVFLQHWLQYLLCNCLQGCMVTSLHPLRPSISAPFTCRSRAASASASAASSEAAVFAPHIFYDQTQMKENAA